jgi:DNA repair exonuclease SbcCD nuclease subunit
LIGNHDIFWRNSLEINSPDLLLRDYDNITLWAKHGTLELDGAVFDMIPWMCNENENEIREFVSKSTSPYCVGHFELVGYYMQRGQVSHEGYEDGFLKDYDQVYSGHYHSRSASVDGKIAYLGTPYELFWSDYKDQKGFGVFDTQSNVFKFVANPNRMFYKLTYDDTKELDEDFSNLKNKYIKIVVVQKTNPQKFDTFMDDIYKMNPIDVTIVEDVNEMVNNEEDVVDQAQDTLTILSNYIDQQTIQVEPQKLKTVMRELYLEALSSETIE